VRVINAGDGCVGWADMGFVGKWASDEGVGNDPDGKSWGFAGMHAAVLHAGKSWKYGAKKWAPRDVIGCAIDMDAGEMRFAINGNWAESGIAFGPSGSVSSDFDATSLVVRPAVTSSFARDKDGNPGKKFEAELLFNSVESIFPPPEKDDGPFLPILLALN